MAYRKPGHWTRKTISRRVNGHPPSTGLVVARVVGEKHSSGRLDYSTSNVRRFAERNRRRPTPSEIRLEIILRSLGDGVLKDRYEAQYVISGKWIVDFFFPENRLAIEVDGSFHNVPEQRRRDALKEADCSRFDITLLRLTNKEVWGDEEKLIARLRSGWGAALNRKNTWIGRPASEFAR